MNQSHFKFGIPVFLFMLFAFLAPANAQDWEKEYQKRLEEQRRKFEQYKNAQQQSFDDYKKAAEAKFAAYGEQMRKKWEEYHTQTGIKSPEFPEPVSQPVKQATTQSVAQALPVASVQASASTDLPVVPAMPTENKVLSMRNNAFHFTYYHTKCTVHMGSEYQFALSSVDESHCADAWSKLSHLRPEELIADCLALKDSLNLGDWGYIQLVKKLADTYYKDANASNLFQMFLLVGSGYKVRIGRVNYKLTLLFPFDCMVYDYCFIEIDGENYFLMADDIPTCTVFKMKFDGEKNPSLLQSGPPALAYSPAKERTFPMRGDTTLRVRPNKNLIDFYADYPHNDRWDYYTRTSLSHEVKSALYPYLLTKISDMSRQNAVDYLLHFVQNSFSYKTDGAQFGYERPLFGEESFYFPYNDCEDRAILFAVLVEELLNLDVVLLEYDGHLSAGVHLEGDLAGSYYELNDGRYYSCDPTYIGAGIGDVMPNYAMAKAKIIRI